MFGESFKMRQGGKAYGNRTSWSATLYASAAEPDAFAAISWA